MEHELRIMMPGEERRQTPILMSEPDFRERPYRDVEEEFKGMVEKYTENLKKPDMGDKCGGLVNAKAISENNRAKYDEAAVRKGYRQLTKLLIEKEMTITTMESATSGQIASLITDTEGSSAVFKGAFVTYCNEAKVMQGVPADILDRYTVYSKETAEAMAAACAKTYQADIGIGVTGTMGNIDPANPDASVPGQVYFAIVINGDMRSYYIELAVQPTRLTYKLAVAKEILDVLVSRVNQVSG